MFCRAETRFRLRGITVQPTTKAGYVLEALPETIFRRIGSWLDQQPEEIPYDDLKKYLLKEFSPTASERAFPADRRQKTITPMGLSRLPEVDDFSKQNKEVDLKKEIWLQSLPSSVRVLLHNTDDKLMIELSNSQADDITMIQNSTRHQAVSPSVSLFPVYWLR